ncbi:hypothetical protein NW754_009628 [Fusarium falciforme]|uniref:Uncharacterized protein n=1 Tax=Fusarium falciforme TaxID=195108 RepID=A0A9W8QSV5_9HYPO|nr:hypothetical protein NW754_009628 [Fusarium falciforme]KAJ4177177.1 hypothetical protein NW755_013996 [Fusarium falciforme]
MTCQRETTEKVENIVGEADITLELLKKPFGGTLGYLTLFIAPVFPFFVIRYVLVVDHA